MQRLPRCLLAAFALVSLVASPARAWPDRPIQIIVPFPAGGTVDVAARGMAVVLSERLSVAVAVVNRDGAAGSIGARAIATARPDGNTLGMTPAGPITTQPQLVRDAGYTSAAFRPICQVFAGYNVLLAGRGGPPTIAAAIAAARAAPGTLSLGYGGNGTAPHWAMLGLQRAAGVEFNAVPFRGDPPVTTALLSGDLALGVLGLGSAIGPAARATVLLAFTTARLAELPDVPTATELGWPVVEEVFGGLVAPASLPDAIAHRLEAECAAAAQDPRVGDALRAARFAVVSRDGAAFAQALAADAEAKRALIAASGLRAE
jgi:tripartite-type tricarboxylate transporter receptor subunit TctC